MAEKTYLQAISDGLRQEMRRDKRVFVLGEDVGVYGGAFKVTLGFQEEFGAVARDRHAALGDGDHGRRDRRGDDGPAPGRRDAVRRLRLLRLGPPRHGRREAALARRHAGADRAAAAVRRRLLRRPVPLAEPGVVVRAHPGAQVRLPGDARGREGPDHRRDRGSEPGALLRAQASVPPHQGRGAGRALHDADRQGAHPRRGRRRHRHHVGRDGLHGRGGGEAAVDALGRDRRPAHDHAVGQAGRARLGAQDVEGARAARGHAHRRLRRRDRRDDRRGGVRGSRRAGEADRRARHARAVLARRSRRRTSRRSTTSSRATQGVDRVLMATGTAVDVVMPQMGVSVSEGTITKWLQAGRASTIEADETLLEISTDKVDTEVPSPASGVVSEILVQEGETVEVGTVLARIGGEAPAPRRSRAAEPATQPAADDRRRPQRADGSEARRPSDGRRAGAAQPAAAASAPDGERQVVRLAGRRAHRLRARDRPVPGRRAPAPAAA